MFCCWVKKGVGMLKKTYNSILLQILFCTIRCCSNKMPHMTSQAYTTDSAKKGRGFSFFFTREHAVHNRLFFFFDILFSSKRLSLMN